MRRLLTRLRASLKRAARPAFALTRVQQGMVICAYSDLDRAMRELARLAKLYHLLLHDGLWATDKEGRTLFAVQKFYLDPRGPQ